MAQHKAATEVTVVAPIEQSGFGLWVERNWKLMAALAALIAVGVLTFQFVQQKRRETLTQSWNRIWEHVEPGGSLAGFVGDAEALAAMQPELAETEAGPWALYLQAKVHAEKREYDAAAAAVLKLQEAYPSHPLVKERFAFEGNPTPLTLSENLLKGVRAQGAWEQGRDHLFANPAPPPDAPRVRIETSEGAIVVQLYPDLAPKHGDNFLKLVREGYYDGTKFHRVEPGLMIQAGDPNSKEEDRSLWGTGGPGYTLEREVNELRHFEGVLAAAKPDGSVESSGSQFYITIGPAHHLDGDYVVFGKVLEGMEAAKWIGGGQLDPSPLRRGQPVEPVSIVSATVL